MEKKFWRNTYYNSYYYANIINNVLSRDIELIGFISNFFNDNRIAGLIQPYQKFSAFHQFINHILYNFFDDDMCSNDQELFNLSQVNKFIKFSPYAEGPLKDHNIEYSFKDFINDKIQYEWTDVEAYHDELRLTGWLEELIEKISQEVFYLLFNNRDALLRLNYIVAEELSSVDVSDIDEDQRIFFKKKNKLKRVSIPEWCKKAVFFRDRGACCLCGKDLTGLVSINNYKHFDHIVPLYLHGLNDVTNLQLLCAECNSKKNRHTIVTSDLYEAWY